MILYLTTILFSIHKSIVIAQDTNSGSGSGVNEKVKQIVNDAVNLVIENDEIHIDANFNIGVNVALSPQEKDFIKTITEKNITDKIIDGVLSTPEVANFIDNAIEEDLPTIFPSNYPSKLSNSVIILEKTSNLVSNFPTKYPTKQSLGSSNDYDEITAHNDNDLESNTVLPLDNQLQNSIKNQTDDVFVSSPSISPSFNNSNNTVLDQSLQPTISLNQAIPNNNQIAEEQQENTVLASSRVAIILCACFVVTAFICYIFIKKYKKRRNNLDEPRLGATPHPSSSVANVEHVKDDDSLPSEDAEIETLGAVPYSSP